ncbi:MAG TPA: tetratricopeptide repeat protein [Candidatus Angelobacter sp.]|nr:tetratricopeptide repeat protein [Candidatus Angelobacter sp.]
MAIQSGDTAAVENTSRKVTAAALRQMALLRSSTGEYAKAIDLYRQSLDLEDVNDVRLELATLYGLNHQPDNSIEEAEKVVITNPSNDRAWAIKGKAYVEKEDYRNAAVALSRALALKRDVNMQYALAYSLLKVKEKEKAAAVFQEMLRDYGDRGIWHEVFGGAYRETKYLDDAIREFQIALKMDPTLPHLHAFLGETMLEKNYWAPDAEIVNQFGEEAKADPNGYFGHFYLGALLSQQGQLQEADPHLKAAIKADPQNPDPWLYLGLNYFKVKDYDNAKSALLKAVELTGKDDARANYQIRRAYISLGRILILQGDKAGAAVHMKKARELSDKTLALSSSAIVAEMAEGSEGAMGSPPAVISDSPLSAAGKPGTAGLGSSTPAIPHLTPEQLRAVAQREKELGNVLGTAFNDWGTSEARQRNYARALGHFREAEKWDPANPELMRNLGLAAFRLGDNREAARALQMVVQKNPQDQAACGMLAMALFSSQQFPAAVKAFDGLGDAVYRDPRMSYAYAFSLAHANDPTRAVEVLNHMVQQPVPSEMLMGVADLYNLTLDYDDALKTYQKVIQQDPALPRAHYYAGDMLIKLGRPDEAIAMFEQEMKITPDDPNVQYHYAYALLQTSRKDEAVSLLQTITAAHPDDAQAQYQLGKTLLDAGQYQQAIDHLEAAAKYDPNHDYVHYQLQAAYRKAGRAADADRELAIYKQIKEQARDEGNPQPKQ